MFHGGKSFIALLLAAETSNREMFLKSLGLPFSQPIRYPLEKWEKLSFRKKMSLFHISMNVNADDVRCSTESKLLTQFCRLQKNETMISLSKAIG